MTPNPFIKQYLRAKKPIDKTNAAKKLLGWSQPDVPDGPASANLVEPLEAGIRRLVQDRCGNYYARDGDLWTRWNILQVDFEGGKLKVERNGLEMEVIVREELGTGVPAAMTVRSLASRSHVPELFTVLLVDEWGDVEPASLAQLVYEDITRLPNPVIALFTLPGTPLKPELSDGQIGARPDE